MAIKNTVSSHFDLLLLIVKGIFNCCLSGVNIVKIIMFLYLYYMSCKARKPVLEVTDQVRFKPASPATETSQNIGILYEAFFRYHTLQEANNISADQTEWMCRLRLLLFAWDR